MKNILEKKAKKFIKLSTDKEIREYAYKWVLFQYKLEELNNFIDEIRKTKELEEDLESENGLYSGAKGNNSLELENTLRDFLLNEYM
mgnify:CR=1 FL=1